jgi:iron(III) transport system substrate-binding protein
MRIRLDRARWICGSLAALAVFASAGCFDPDTGKGEVVVYTSVDQNYSEPLFREFKAATGISVRPVYDIEAAKTTGLVNRLVAEKTAPQADLFWNGEVMQLHRLMQQGVLAPIAPAELPNGVRTAGDGYWLEFGGRARVLIVNDRKLLGRAAPGSIADLVSPDWPGSEIAVAYPLFGTMATHAAVLDSVWGRERTLAFFEEIKARGVRLVDGNSVVRDLVAGGHATFGLTDTDDACGAVARGAAVHVVLPDQADGQDGALVIPNGAAMIAGGPNPENARRFLDYLTGPKALQVLSEAGWLFVSGDKVVADPACGLPTRIRVLRFPQTLPDDAFAGLRNELRARIVR